jgi:Ca2+-binding EF-hand superfamily protein
MCIQRKLTRIRLVVSITWQDGSGALDQTELQQLMAEMQVPYEESTVKSLLKEIDEDGRCSFN